MRIAGAKVKYGFCEVPLATKNIFIGQMRSSKMVEEISRTYVLIRMSRAIFQPTQELLIWYIWNPSVSVAWSDNYNKSPKLVLTFYM